jgi:hypothetical protein
MHLDIRSSINQLRTQRFFQSRYVFVLLPIFFLISLIGYFWMLWIGGSLSASAFSRAMMPQVICLTHLSTLRSDPRVPEPWDMTVFTNRLANTDRPLMLHPPEMASLITGIFLVVVSRPPHILPSSYTSHPSAARNRQSTRSRLSFRTCR